MENHNYSSFNASFDIHDDWWFSSLHVHNGCAYHCFDINLGFTNLCDV